VPLAVAGASSRVKVSGPFHPQMWTCDTPFPTDSAAPRTLGTHAALDVARSDKALYVGRFDAAHYRSVHQNARHIGNEYQVVGGQRRCKFARRDIGMTL